MQPAKLSFGSPGSRMLNVSFCSFFVTAFCNFVAFFSLFALFVGGFVCVASRWRMQQRDTVGVEIGVSVFLVLLILFVSAERPSVLLLHLWLIKWRFLRNSSFVSFLLVDPTAQLQAPSASAVYFPQGSDQHEQQQQPSPSQGMKNDVGWLLRLLCRAERVASTFAVNPSRHALGGIICFNRICRRCC